MPGDSARDKKASGAICNDQDAASEKDSEQNSTLDHTISLSQSLSQILSFALNSALCGGSALQVNGPLPSAMPYT